MRVFIGRGPAAGEEQTMSRLVSDSNYEGGAAVTPRDPDGVKSADAAVVRIQKSSIFLSITVLGIPRLKTTMRHYLAVKQTQFPYPATTMRRLRIFDRPDRQSRGLVYSATR
ncbi:hypothetical protein EVAR_31566_1 [Eumeta japonica]|uniref:Uncharacterized protein n=1 Tax=Eumeta variegata TaxID=151549 RepID=A0A4C1V8T0_EUMVA|nr:hypothetical protein EVAR_31566_1 [Eumeta japonica]